MKQIRKSWTQNEIDELLRLKDSMTTAKLGEHFGVSKKQITEKLYYIKRFQKNGVLRVNNGWTEQEDDSLLILRKDKTVKEIAAILDRTEYSVSSRLCQLSFRITKQRPKKDIDRILNCESVEDMIELCKELNLSMNYVLATRYFSGKKTHRIFKILNGMIERCYNVKNENYYRYGERGIFVCDEWKNDPIKFYKWAIENGFSDNLQIDRINNNDGYHPENCRWVTQKENNNNKENNVKIEAFGEIKTISQWKEDPRCTVNRKTIYNRCCAKPHVHITNEQRLTYNRKEYIKLVHSKGK